MLSIIVPVRNEMDNVREIFDYFSGNLKELNFEVIIINDFSEDNTFEEAKSLSNNYENFKIINNQKRAWEEQLI